MSENISQLVLHDFLWHGCEFDNINIYTHTLQCTIFLWLPLPHVHSADASVFLSVLSRYVESAGDMFVCLMCPDGHPSAERLLLLIQTHVEPWQYTLSQDHGHIIKTGNTLVNTTFFTILGCCTKYGRIWKHQILFSDSTAVQRETTQNDCLTQSSRIPWKQNFFHYKVENVINHK